MADVPLCEHRRVELGRLYCDAATRRGERATSETFNRTCQECRVATIRAAHPCVHLDIGIELTEHRDRSTLDAYHLACRVTKIDVETAEGCTPECPHFEAMEEERRLSYDAAANMREIAAETDAARRAGRRLDL
ncbi:MAG TPA: hypothetical protein VM221_03320 [Armatimonadota bacterium]|nr:hypothetical protein [Armatimonadota bacterium]